MPGGVSLEGGSIHIGGSKIRAVLAANEKPSAAIPTQSHVDDSTSITIDATGLFVSAGFIDPHTHVSLFNEGVSGTGAFCTEICDNVAFFCVHALCLSYTVLSFSLRLHSPLPLFLFFLPNVSILLYSLSLSLCRPRSLSLALSISSGHLGNDCNDNVDPVAPYLRALDAIYHNDAAFEHALTSGVTTLAVTPGA